MVYTHLVLDVVILVLRYLDAWMDPMPPTSSPFFDVLYMKLTFRYTLVIATLYPCDFQAPMQCHCGTSAGSPDSVLQKGVKGQLIHIRSHQVLNTVLRKCGGLVRVIGCVSKKRKTWTWEHELSIADVRVVWDWWMSVNEWKSLRWMGGNTAQLCVRC